MTTDRPPIERKLAAILAADIAGYSTLMGDDEEMTVRDLKGHQSVILPMVSEYGGRVIDTAGDGILAEYPSALNAVRCAVEIQQTMAERNAGVPPGRQMRFRIGVNLGDIVYDADRIYGDGVNIAARLEAIAPPGGICVSRSVREAVGNKLSVAFADLGEKQVKNIAAPVHTYEIKLLGGTVPLPSETAGPPRRSRLLPASLLAQVLLMFAAGSVVATAILAGIHLVSPQPPPLPASALQPGPPVGVKIVDQPLRDQPAPKPAEVEQPRASLAQPEALPTAPSPVQEPGPASQAAAQPSPSPSSVAVETGLGSFDGVWRVSFTGGTHCGTRSGTFKLTIVQGRVLESRPDAGTVDATGAVSYTLPGSSDRRITVEHRGRLVGDVGSGDYRARGGECTGVTEFMRLTREVAPHPAATGEAASNAPKTDLAPPEAKPAAQQGFDGTWQVTGAGGPYCFVKSNTWDIVILNGMIAPSHPTAGRISPDGAFQFTGLSKVDSKAIVYYRGMLAGDTGRGTYASGKCLGTLDLKRRPATNQQPSGKIARRGLFTHADLQRVMAIGKKHALVFPEFAIDEATETVGANRRFVGIWASEVGYGGSGRQAMLIVTKVTNQGEIEGYLLRGPPTAASSNRNPATYLTIRASIADEQFSWNNRTTIRTARLFANGSMTVTDRSADGHEGTVTLKPVWTLLEAERAAKQ